MRALLFGGLVACAALTGCSSIFDKHVEYTYIEPDSYPVLKAVGYAPISAQPGSNESQRTLLAIKASKLEAYRELLSKFTGKEFPQALQCKTALLIMINYKAKYKV